MGEVLNVRALTRWLTAVVLVAASVLAGPPPADAADTSASHARANRDAVANEPTVKAMLASGCALGVRQDDRDREKDHDCWWLREKALREASNIDDRADGLSAKGNDLAALPLYQRALAIRQKVEGPDGETVNLSLLELSVVYQRIGQPEQAILYRRNWLANKERLSTTTTPDLIDSLVTMAQLYVDLGRNTAALDLYKRVLTLEERSPGAERFVATYANLVGVIYQNVGQYDNALRSFRRALSIRKREFGSNSLEVAEILNNLGSLYIDLGQNGGALILFGRSLDIRKRVSGPNSDDVAEATHNLSVAYSRTGQYQRALELAQRAAEIWGPASHQEDWVASSANLSLIAGIYKRIGQYDDALVFYQRVLVIRERALGTENWKLAGPLDSLAALYLAMGRSADALPLALRAYWLSQQAEDPEFVIQALATLARVENELGDRQEAIFFAKLGVAETESQRKRLQKLDRVLLESYIDGDRQSIYRDLSGWLAKEGRLGEAEQVLELLRGQELRERTRGAESTQHRRESVQLCVGPECAAQDQQTRLRRRTGEIARDLDQLARQSGRLSNERRQQLETERDRLAMEFEESLATLKDRLARFMPADVASERVQRERDATQVLSSTLEALGPGTVALRYLVLPEQVIVFVVSGQTVRMQEVAVSEEQLNDAVANLRQSILERRPEVLNYARELYDWLLTPVADDIAAAMSAGPEAVLMIAPDKVLGLLPFAALHDGERYVAEKWAVAEFNDAVRDNLQAKPTVARQRAFGLSSLSAAKDELAGLSKAVPGDAPLLDARFTEQALKETFERNRVSPGTWPIVHVASHFQFIPGDEFRSGLTLGDGGTVDLFKLKGWKFTNTELLTLSACETGESGGVAGPAGLQLDGFGQVAQKNGAHAVLATLWAVNDAASGHLMRRFYELHYGDFAPLNKAEALRRAQVEMIRIDAAPAAISSNRQAGRPGDLRPTPPEAVARLNHPYYWAGFILMGNWK